MAVDDAKVIVEASIIRARRERFVPIDGTMPLHAQVPLSDAGSGVAPLLQQARHGALAFAQLVRLRGVQLRRAAVVAPGIAASQKPKPRRRARRRRRVSIGES